MLIGVAAFAVFCFGLRADIPIICVYVAASAASFLAAREASVHPRYGRALILIVGLLAGLFAGLITGFLFGLLEAVREDEASLVWVIAAGHSVGGAIIGSIIGPLIAALYHIMTGRKPTGAPD
jgi:prepilin signal peptidase PulO-like enzyme (type II secretory pathway)